MKIELNIINKEKFCALYWGQRVALYYDNVFDYDFEYPEGWIKDTTLILTPLEKITDEDAIAVAKIVARKYFSHFKENHVSLEHSLREVKIFTHLYEKKHTCSVVIGETSIGFQNARYTGSGADEFYVYNQYEAYQYLISKGYATPWMGYNVKELVEAGWIKLKE